MLLVSILVLFQPLDRCRVVHQLVRPLLTKSDWTLNKVAQELERPEDSLIN